MTDSHARSARTRRGTRRRVLFAPLAALFAAALVTLGLTPVASAASTPTVTVTPSTGLSNGQSVTVTGSGFTADVTKGSPVFVVECAANGTGASDCYVDGVKAVTPGADGTFTVSDFVVAQKIGTIDCAQTNCVIQANAGTTADAPRGTSSVLQFGEASPPTSTSGTTTTTTTQTTTSSATTSSSSAESSTRTSSSTTSGSSSTESSPMTTSSQGSSPTGSTKSTTTSSTPQETTAIEVQDASGSSPAITVSPSSGLSDGDTVTVSGSHYPANTQVYVVECAKNASGASGCNVGGVQIAQTDGSGSFTVSGFAVAQSFKDTDCTQTACVIQGNAGTTPDAPRGTSVALQFGAAGSSTSASTGGGNGGTSGTAPTMTIGASSGQLASTGTPTYAIAALGAILLLLGGGALWLSRQRSSRIHSSHAH